MKYYFVTGDQGYGPFDTAADRDEALEPHLEAAESKGEDLDYRCFSADPLDLAAWVLAVG